MTKPLSAATATFLKFQSLALAVASHPSAPSLDANEAALLIALSLHWHTGRPLAVREAMTLHTYGSPSTLHRRISALKAKGLLTDESSPGNLRIKLLVPTSKALAHFDKLGNALQKSVR